MIFNLPFELITPILNKQKDIVNVIYISISNHKKIANQIIFHNQGVSNLMVEEIIDNLKVRHQNYKKGKYNPFPTTINNKTKKTNRRFTYKKLEFLHKLKNFEKPFENIIDFIFKYPTQCHFYRANNKHLSNLPKDKNYIFKDLIRYLHGLDTEFEFSYITLFFMDPDIRHNSFSKRLNSRGQQTRIFFATSDKKKYHLGINKYIEIFGHAYHNYHNNYEIYQQYFYNTEILRHNINFNEILQNNNIFTRDVDSHSDVETLKFINYSLIMYNNLRNPVRKNKMCNGHLHKNNEYLYEPLYDIRNKMQEHIQKIRMILYNGLHLDEHFIKKNLEDFTFDSLFEGFFDYFTGFFDWYNMIYALDCINDFIRSFIETIKIIQKHKIIFINHSKTYKFIEKLVDYDTLSNYGTHSYNFNVLAKTIVIYLIRYGNLSYNNPAISGSRTLAITFMN